MSKIHLVSWVSKKNTIYLIIQLMTNVYSSLSLSLSLINSIRLFCINFCDCVETLQSSVQGGRGIVFMVTAAVVLKGGTSKVLGMVHVT